jgi:hypothetical protein
LFLLLHSQLHGLLMNLKLWLVPLYLLDHSLLVSLSLAPRFRGGRLVKPTFFDPRRVVA